MVSTTGKLKNRDEMIARLWKWLPPISFFLLTVPVPLALVVLFLLASTPESAALYLVFAGLTLGVGALLGAIIVLFLLIYRHRWLRKLRDRLAEDGITAGEVDWFKSELTSAERKTLSEIQRHNPLLADAYCETLASRLTATRILVRARNERLKVERRINRARSLTGADTTALLKDLNEDHEQLERVRIDASARLAESRARLQMIEASASRTLNRKETDLMLGRLAQSQNHLPLAIEMAKLEQDMLLEAELESNLSLPERLDNSSR